MPFPLLLCVSRHGELLFEKAQFACLRADFGTINNGSTQRTEPWQGEEEEEEEGPRSREQSPIACSTNIYLTIQRRDICSVLTVSSGFSGSNYSTAARSRSEQQRWWRFLINAKLCRRARARRDCGDQVAASHRSVCTVYVHLHLWAVQDNRACSNMTITVVLLRGAKSKHVPTLSTSPTQACTERFGFVLVMVQWEYLQNVQQIGDSELFRAGCVCPSA